jgi:hypothetical protein
MKLADGGFRPAYNLQFATDTASRIIVGVGACNAGTDSQQLVPMLDQIEQRTGCVPAQHLADGGYMNFAAVEQAAARGVEVFVPPRENRTYHIDPLTPQPRDSAAVAEYRKRMGSPQGQRIYLERAATAETVNADLKTWRGLDRLAGARHRQGADRRDLVGAGVQPAALDQNGLGVRLPLSANFLRRSC